RDQAAPPPSTLSLHDALPISSTTSPAQLQRRVSNGSSASVCSSVPLIAVRSFPPWDRLRSKTSSSHARRSRPSPCPGWHRPRTRSEEHTSELQSRENLVCRLL